MTQRAMGVAVGMLALLAGAMGGCQPKETGSPAASKPAAPSADAPKPEAPAVPAAADKPATETPAAAAAEEPKEYPPEEAIKLPGADPGWPAPGTKPVMVSRTPDGAILEDYVIGEGLPTLPGAMVTIHYVARVKGGEMFDSTYGSKRARRSLTSGLMPALQDSVIGMKKGGKRRVILEPRLAYGERGLKNAKGEEVVPPGATVIFDLELVEVRQELKLPGSGTETPKP